MAPIDAKTLFAEFAAEARELLQASEETLLAVGEGRVEVGPVVEKLLRDLHTLKGNAGMVGLTAMQERAHQLEDQVAALEGAPELPVDELLEVVDELRQLLATGGPSGSGPSGEGATPGSIRVPWSRLDALVERLAALVVLKNRLSELLDQGRRRPERAVALLAEAEAVDDQLTLALSELRDRILELRMVPLEPVFQRVRRLVHDEGARQGKQVELVLEGGNTPLDKALLELASEALGHLVRNAVVHGIELPAARRRAGKPAQGRIRLSARTRSSEVTLEIEDDGAGIDREALRRAARNRDLDDADLLTLLTRGGVTTREEADLSAGRGRGVAAVAEAVRRHGGRLAVESRFGHGTRFELRLPLRVSIVRALLVECDGETYALPLVSLLEAIPAEDSKSTVVQGVGILAWRGGMVPVLDLGRAMGTAGERPERRYLAIIEAEGKRRALALDALGGIREGVVEPLDLIFGAPPGIAGSTILGDGRTILILDPPALATTALFPEAT
jgi:two-component system chemotaxis sensor kinase CheA